MDSPRDAEVEQVLRASTPVRIARAAFVAVDEAIASSATARIVARLRSRRALGCMLIVASLVHAALVTFEPAVAAPAGRYAFAVAGLLGGIALLLTAA